MNKVSLSGMVRNATGTKDAAQLRREKRVPCVLYGGDSPVHFSVEESALRPIVFTPEVNTIELDLEGSTVLAMMHQKQFHPTTDRVLHLDFLQIQEGKEARATLSVRLRNQPMGVRRGGVMNQPMRKLRVMGLPSNIPQHLDVDVEDLDINQSIKVSDLKFDGLTMMERPDDVVVAVKTVKKKEEVVVPGAAPAAAAAPEKKAAPAKK
ncbi:MAG: 50S ribosomal protein L25 [Bacteroidota bacterium]|nr:50S ribosomal protein L25 [Bacteroidota bacterium]